MKASRKSILALIGAMAMGTAMAAPSVEIVSVQQQYPWTNTVDIVYNVAGVASETNGYFVVFTPTTSDGKDILDVNGEKSVQVALKGSGVYSTQWFPQTNLQYTACKMTPAVYRGGSGGGKDYMIVDLLTGAVAYEPMATQEASNERYNTLEYKTKKLVLRRVEAGTYTIGAPRIDTRSDRGDNTTHEVVMSKAYYVGIFSLTEAQWSLIMDGDGTSQSIIPRRFISYNTIRGNALPGAVPSTGIMKTLRDKTGLQFDLPTESMMFVAAAAGVTTTYLTGDSYTGLADYAWTGDGVHGVGLKRPNNWGLYDVCGNVWEWARDAWDATDLAVTLPDGLTPATAGTGRSSVLGDYTNQLSFQTLAYRSGRSANSSADWMGFRISVIETW